MSADSAPPASSRQRRLLDEGSVAPASYALLVTNERDTQVRPTLAELISAGAVVVDGGMGTLLHDKGLDDCGSG